MTAERTRSAIGLIIGVTIGTLLASVLMEIDMKDIAQRLFFISAGIVTAAIFMR